MNGTRSPAATVKSATVVEVLAAQWRRACATTRRVRAGDGRQAAVDPLHPRHDGAVVEADDQFHAASAPGRACPRRRGPGSASPSPHRHAVDHGDGALGRLVVGFEDQRAVAVAAADGADLAGGGRAASGRGPACRAARRSRRRSRSAASTASRWSRRGRPARRCGSRRSGRNLRCARTWVALFRTRDYRRGHKPPYLNTDLSSLYSAILAVMLRRDRPQMRAQRPTLPWLFLSALRMYCCSMLGDGLAQQLRQRPVQVDVEQLRRRCGCQQLRRQVFRPG